MRAMRFERRRRDGSPALAVVPVDGHRMELELLLDASRRRATCECGWIGGFCRTAQDAADEWRDHVGIVA